MLWNVKVNLNCGTCKKLKISWSIFRKKNIRLIVVITTPVKWAAISNLFEFIQVFAILIVSFCNINRKTLKLCET